jgi:hypothetical protein
MLFFAREEREEKNHRLCVEQSALDPAELAWRKVREFGIEQASRHGSECHKEREDYCALSNKVINFFAPAMLAERGEDDREQKYHNDIGCDGAERKEVGNELDEWGHEDILKVN